MKIAGRVITGITIAIFTACALISAQAFDSDTSSQSPSILSIPHNSTSLDTNVGSKLSGTSLLPGQSTSVKMTYAYSSADKNGGVSSNLLTYGVSATIGLGSGSRLSGLMYASRPQTARLIINELAGNGGKSKISKSDLTSGRMIVQNADLNFGKATIKLGYQDIDKGFSGFSALRDSNAAPTGVLQQLEKEKGLKRLNLQSTFDASKDTKLSAGMEQVREGSSGILSQNYGVTTGKLKASFTSRQVDKDFKRIGDLSAKERTDMAVAVRQQFDPNATAAQVTDADRAAISNEAGIERSNIRVNYAVGKVGSGFQVLNISDGAGDVKRNTISLGGKDFSITWMQQSISDKFGKLSLLSPIEQGQFGNEHGMDRTSLSSTGKIGNTNVGLSFSKVGDNEGSVTKRSLSVQNKNMDVKANFQEVSPNFKRSLDLADPNRKQLVDEQGYKKTDLTANFKISGSLSMDNYVLRMRNDKDGLDKNQMQNRITFAPNPGTKITMFRDSYSFKSSQGTISSYLHQSFGLDQKFGGMQFNALRDTNTVKGGDGNEQTTTTTSLHLESDRNKRTWLSLDNRTTSVSGGGTENMRAWSFQTRPMGTMLLKSSMMNISRSNGADESFSNQSLDWQIGKNLRATADISKHDVENTGVTDLSRYTLSGGLGKNLLGLKDTRFTATMSKETQNGEVKKQDDRVIVDTKVLGGSATFEMAKGLAGDGNPTKRQGIRFFSNRNPNKWMHFDIGYAVRDIGAGDPFIARVLNLDMRINAKTNLVYSYFSYIEKPDGTVDNKGGSNIRLTTALNKKLNLTADYGTADDYICGTRGLRLGFGIVGHLSNGAAVELYYGMSDLLGPIGDVTDEIYRLKYDKKVNDNHFVSFSGVLTTQDDHNPATRDASNIETRLDLRRVFW